MPPEKLEDDDARLQPGQVVCQLVDDQTRAVMISRAVPRAAKRQDWDDTRREEPSQLYEVQSVDGVLIKGEFRGSYKFSDSSFARAGMALLALGDVLDEARGAAIQRQLHLPSFRFVLPERDAAEHLELVLAFFQRQSPLLVLKALLACGTAASGALHFAQNALPRVVPEFIGLVDAKAYPRKLAPINANLVLLHGRAGRAAATEFARRCRRERGSVLLRRVELADEGDGDAFAKSAADAFNDAVEGGRRLG